MMWAILYVIPMLICLVSLGYLTYDDHRRVKAGDFSVPVVVGAIWVSLIPVLNLILAGIALQVCNDTVKAVEKRKLREATQEQE